MGLVAELAIGLGFDWVAYPVTGMVHVSVIPDACQTKVDLLFVNDGSGSMTHTGWAQEMQFFKDVIDYFDIGPDATRVASVSYAERSRIDFDFNKYTDKASLKAAIGGLVYDTGQTLTCHQNNGPSGTGYRCPQQCEWGQQWFKVPSSYEIMYGGANPNGECHDYKQANSCRCGIGSNTFYCITPEGQCSTSTMDALADGYKLFQPSRGARPISDGVPKVAIVLTDGGSNIAGYKGGDGSTNTIQAQTATINAGKALKSLNVNVFPVALGQNIKETELRGFASEPVNEHFFRFESISSMPKYVEKMATFSCNEPSVVNGCEEVETTVEQGDFRYLKHKLNWLNGDTLVVQVDDLEGGTDVFVSKSEKNPGPYANDLKSVGGAAYKILRSADKPALVYVALQGRTPGTSRAKIQFCADPPDLTVCTDNQQSKCGVNTCQGTGRPAGSNDADVKCTDPDDPTLEVCTTQQETKCGPKECVVDGASKVCKDPPPDLTICTESQQAKCGPNKCTATGKPAYASDGDVKCTDPDDPDIEVCTAGLQKKCGTQLCVVDGGSKRCEDPPTTITTTSATTTSATTITTTPSPPPPDLTVCTGGQQTKCGSNTCTPTGKPAGSSDADVKCTDPNNPDIEVCTTGLQTKCGTQACVVDGGSKFCDNSPETTTTIPDLSVCTPGQQAKCGASTCTATDATAGDDDADVKCTDPDDPTVEVCTVLQNVKCGSKACVVNSGSKNCEDPPDLTVCTGSQQVKCGANKCTGTGKSAGNSDADVKCTDPKNPDLEVCTAFQSSKCGSKVCVVDGGQKFCEDSTSTTTTPPLPPPDLTVCTPGQQTKCGSNTCKPTGNPAGFDGDADIKCFDPSDPTDEVCTGRQHEECGSQPCRIGADGSATCDEPPDLSLCTVDQRAKCGTNACEATGNVNDDVKCTDPQNPGIEVCTVNQEEKCGSTACVIATDGTPPACAGPPELSVCTAGQQTKCGTNTCKPGGNGAGTKCTDPNNPDVEVCTVEQDARCGTTPCTVSEAGIPASCAGPPNLEECTPGQQVKCGLNACRPVPGIADDEVTCTKPPPGNPDIEVCTVDQQNKCGSIPCVVNKADGGSVSRCAGPLPSPGPPGLTFFIDPQSDTGNVVCRDVRVPCEGMTPTVYIVVESPEPESTDITIESSFQGGNTGEGPGQLVRDLTKRSRKVIKYSPPVEFDQLHLGLCGSEYTVQVLLDLLINTGPIVLTGPAPVLGTVLHPPLQIGVGGYGSVDEDYNVVIRAPGSTNDGMVEYLPNVGIIVSVAGDGGGVAGFTSGQLEVYITPKIAGTSRCLHGMTILDVEVPVDTLLPFDVQWTNGGEYTVDNLEEYSESPVVATGNRIRRSIPAEEGSVVVQVEAIAGSGSTIESYAINSGNSLGGFAISNDGIVTVADPAVLDADDADSATFALSIVAVDSQQRRSAQAANVAVSLINLEERPMLDLIDSTEVQLAVSSGGNGKPVLRVEILNPEEITPIACSVTAAGVDDGWLEAAHASDYSSCAVFFGADDVAPDSSVVWPISVTVSLLYDGVLQDSKVALFQLAEAAKADAVATGDKKNAAGIAVPIVFVLILVLALLFFFLYWKPKQSEQQANKNEPIVMANPTFTGNDTGAPVDDGSYGDLAGTYGASNDGAAPSSTVYATASDGQYFDTAPNNVNSNINGAVSNAQYFDISPNNGNVSNGAVGTEQYFDISPNNENAPGTSVYATASSGTYAVPGDASMTGKGYINKAAIAKAAAAAMSNSSAASRGQSGETLYQVASGGQPARKGGYHAAEVYATENVGTTETSSASRGQSGETMYQVASGGNAFDGSGTVYATASADGPLPAVPTQNYKKKKQKQKQNANPVVVHPVANTTGYINKSAIAKAAAAAEAAANGDSAMYAIATSGLGPAAASGLDYDSAIESSATYATASMGGADMYDTAGASQPMYATAGPAAYVVPGEDGTMYAMAGPGPAAPSGLGYDSAIESSATYATASMGGADMYDVAGASQSMYATAGSAAYVVPGEDGTMYAMANSGTNLPLYATAGPDAMPGSNGTMYAMAGPDTAGYDNSAGMYEIAGGGAGAPGGVRRGGKARSSGAYGFGGGSSETDGSNFGRKQSTYDGFGENNEEEDC